jgi:type I restriction enzyme S subunit
VLKIKDVNAQGRFQGSFSGRVDAQFAKRYPKQQLVGGETLILNAAHSATHVASKTFYAEQDVSSSLATGEWLIVRWNMEAVDSRYGNYWINSSETRFRLRRLVKGIHLYPKDVARLKVPLPPLAEQQRIAAILDQADAVRQKRQEALALTDEFLQATFLDMFGDPVTNPKGWPELSFLELADGSNNCFVNGPFGSNLLTRELTTDGVPVSYIRDIRDGKYKRISTSCVTPSKAKELNYCHVDSGDVLIAKVGDPPGTAAVYPEELESGIVSQDVIRIRINRDITSPIFITQFLNSPFGRRLLKSIIVKATRERFSLTAFKKLKLGVPPRTLQSKFEGIASLINDSHVLHKTNFEKSDNLFNALVQRAFRGDL